MVAGIGGEGGAAPGGERLTVAAEGNSAEGVFLFDLRGERHGGGVAEGFA